MLRNDFRNWIFGIFVIWCYFVGYFWFWKYKEILVGDGEEKLDLIKIVLFYKYIIEYISLGFFFCSKMFFSL